MIKLALGTAQFGLDYGINNPRGKIPKKEVFEILSFALKNGVDTLDTAYNYGDAEKVIGEWISKLKVKSEKLKVISKVPKVTDTGSVSDWLLQSLKMLNIRQLYGYLFHDFESFRKNHATLQHLQQFKLNGLVKKIGFSLYYPSELDYLFKHNVGFDLVQVPYNILDQRFASYFPELKKKGIEVHVRSVFLQGLLFKKPDELIKQFMKIKPKLIKLNQLAQKLNIPLSAVCLNFTAFNKNIDKIVIGVNSIENLKENLNTLRFINKLKSAYKELLRLKETDENIILPTKWKS